MKPLNKYVLPIKLKKGYKASYGLSPAHEGRLKHSIDFIVQEGTPIFAASSGVVVDVKDDSDIGGRERKYDKFGNYIEIKHAYGEYSIYEHIRKEGSLVKIGDMVKEGDLIGYSGNTGWIATLGPHLHFDVHRYYEEGPEDYETIPILWKDKKTENKIQSHLVKKY